MVPGLGLVLWRLNLKRSSWKSFWKEFLLELQPVVPVPLSPDLHHCGEDSGQDKTSFLGLSLWLNFLQPFACTPFPLTSFKVRAQPPPRLQYSTQNIGQVEFCKQKLNIPAWPLFPPEGRFALSPCSSRRPGWATSVGMFSNLITYPCLKLFMVH